MHITYHGLSCFKIVAKSAGRGSDDVTIMFAPFDKSVGLRPPQAQTDVVLIPHTDPAFNNPRVVRGTPVVIDIPGEYAVQGAHIVGFDAPADLHDGTTRAHTVVYILDIEGVKIVYLGALGASLTPDQLDMVAGADILFIPVGDPMGLDGKTAETLARQIEAGLIIPMHYAQDGLQGLKLRDVKDFCSNIGNCPSTREEKLIIKAQDVAQKKMEVAILRVV